jgi:2-octaprenyl-6-methoxyphenol hydroxylase
MSISSAKPDVYDVAIVGAGMAGLTLALALNQGGLSCVLIEKQGFEAQLDKGFDGRASAIAYACFRQWEALGVGEALKTRACRMDEIMVTDGQLPGAATPKPLPFFLHFAAGEISDRTGNEPLGYMVENRHIREVLHKATGERGINLITPDEIANNTEDAGGVTLNLKSGTELRARLLVSAEGRNSSLRQKAGIGYINWGYGQSAVVATVKMQRPHNHVAYEHFLPTGPFAILPLSENRACLVWSELDAKAGALLAMDEALFYDHLYRRFGEFAGDFSLVGERFIYPLGLGLAEQMYKGRLCLLADAAHGIHPIAGQGLNLGLKDVAALAEVLIEAARLGEDIASPLVLERYARWRRFDNVTTAVVMDGFVRLFSNNNPLLRPLRGIGIGLVNRLSPLRKLFMEDAGAATGDLPRLLKGEQV